MKKILIISYHSLPFDVIASYRANAYLKHLGTYGWNPTLLTHYIGMKSQMEVSREEYEYGTIFRIPIKKSRMGRITAFLEKMIIINKLSILIRWIFGYLDARPEDIDSYFSLKSFCYKKLEIDQFDVVMGIFSPHHHLRLCYKLNKRFKIPYVLDFRDLWDNRVMQEQYIPTITEKIQDFLTKFYWSKYLDGVSFFTTTSEPWKLKTESVTNSNGYVITNGFDSEEFNDVKTLEDEFIIVHAGSLYEHQELEIFLRGVQIFLSLKEAKNFKIKFIGANRTGGLKNKKVGFMNNPLERIRQYLHQEICEITSRRSKNDTISEMSRSQILLFFGHPTIKGWYSGKIYDYLASKKNILVIPDDGSVVSKLIIETKSGHIANSAREVADYLKAKYSEWEKNGNVIYVGDEEKIKKYSRESQTEKLAYLLNKVIN